MNKNAPIFEAAQALARALRAELVTVEQFIDDYRRFAGAVAVARDKTRLSQSAFESVVTEILEEAASPMTRRQILTALHERGLSVGGECVLKNIGTKMWRARAKFRQIAGRGYWLVDRPTPGDAA